MFSHHIAHSLITPVLRFSPLYHPYTSFPLHPAFTLSLRCASLHILPLLDDFHFTSLPFITLLDDFPHTLFFFNTPQQSLSLPSFSRYFVCRGEFLILLRYHIITDKINKGKVDWMWGTCKRREKCVWNVGRKTWKKRRLGRPRRRWEHSSIVYLQEAGIRCGQYSYIVVHNRAAGRAWRPRWRTFSFLNP